MGERFAVRVISLEDSHERRRLVADNLAMLNLPWRFKDAFREDGPCFVEEDRDRQLIRYGRSLRPGEVGCFKSHIAVLEEFAGDPSLQWLMILEDDVLVDVSFDFSGLVSQLDKMGIRYLRLYATRFRPAKVVMSWRTHHIIRFQTGPYGTQAYLISRAGAARFLASLRSIDMPIDDELGRFWHNGLPIYSIFPFPIVERVMRSIIEGERNEVPRIERSARARQLRGKRLLYRAMSYGAKTARNMVFRLSLSDRAN